MASIVEGLFGMSPRQVQQQQQSQIDASAAKYAAQDPFQRATMGMYQTGAGLAGAGAGMLGMQNPDVVAAQQNQQFAGQIDMSTPEGIMEGAKAAQARGDTEMALKLTMLARQMQEEEARNKFNIAQANKMERDASKPEAIEQIQIEKIFAAKRRAEQAAIFLLLMRYSVKLTVSIERAEYLPVEVELRMKLKSLQKKSY